MTKEERIHICEAAGIKTTYCFRFRSPFMIEVTKIAGKRASYHFVGFQWPFTYKEVWGFGGNCGCCGKFNWQWCDPGGRWTGPCKECCEGLVEKATELVRENTRVLPGSLNCKGG